MLFFDLNIPYLEAEKPNAGSSSAKQNRLKLIVKAMELGYSGIAYNRTIKGVMSESDRCTIPPFPLSSLLKLSPSLSSTVSFHRRLLGVPDNSPFRQYSRLTVLVETSSQVSALNSGNPILKTYDLVAVRPLNQNAFDQVCQSSEVDLIYIDFTEKLPFRLKLPMVKAAIARGVYFEIPYSSLMEDVQVRRQMISNAKLLVEWTRGKNIIVSSAAPSVLELRGPNDVANLSSLLGLSNEHAKAAISKTCRSLIANALRKKYFYKEAIKVEVLPAGAQTDPKEPWIVDYLNWDPLSCGEGDLLLDDMAKSFANSGTVSKPVKAIDFASIVDSGLSHGLQIKTIGERVEDKSHPFGNAVDLLSTSKDVETLKRTEKQQRECESLCSSHLDQHGNTAVKSQRAILSHSPDSSPIMEACGTASPTILQELQKSDALEGNISLVGLHEADLQNHVATHADDILFSDSIRETPSRDTCLDVRCSADTKEEVLIQPEYLNCPGTEADSTQLVLGVLHGMEAGVSTEKQLDDHSDLSLCSDINSTVHDGKMMDVDSFIERKNSDDMLLGDCQQLEEVAKEPEQSSENHTIAKTDAKESLISDTMMQVDESNESKDSNNLLVSKCMTSEDLMLKARKQVKEFAKAENQSLGENKSGNHKVKRMASGQALRFPFKRLLQVQFKKRGRISMYKTKKRTVATCLGHAFNDNACTFIRQWTTPSIVVAAA